MFRVPIGALEGLPAFTLSPAAWVPEDPQSLLRAAREALPGEQVAMLSNDFPWTDPALAHALQVLASEAPGITRWIRVRAGERPLPPVPCWTVADASEAVTIYRPMAELTTWLAALPPTPAAPMEIVVENPHRANLTGVVLDEIAAYLGGEHGWLYVSADLMPAAEAAVRRAHSCWGLRAR